MVLFVKLHQSSIYLRYDDFAVVQARIQKPLALTAHMLHPSSTVQIEKAHDGCGVGDEHGMPVDEAVSCQSWGHFIEHDLKGLEEGLSADGEAVDLAAYKAVHLLHVHLFSLFAVGLQQSGTPLEVAWVNSHVSLYYLQMNIALQSMNRAAHRGPPRNTNPSPPNYRGSSPQPSRPPPRGYNDQQSQWENQSHNRQPSPQPTRQPYPAPNSQGGRGAPPQRGRRQYQPPQDDDYGQPSYQQQRQPREYSPNVPPPPYQQPRGNYRQQNDFQEEQNQQDGGFQQRRDRRGGPRQPNYQQDDRGDQYRQPQREQQPRQRDNGRDYNQRDNTRQDGMNRQYDNRRTNNRGRGRGRYNSDERNEQQTEWTHSRNQTERGRGRGRGNTKRGQSRPPPVQTQQRPARPPKKVMQQPKPMEEESAGSPMESSEQGSESQYESSQEQASEDSGSYAEQNSVSEAGSSILSEQSEEQEAEDENEQVDEEGSSQSIALQRIDVMCSKDEFNERLETFNMNNRNVDFDSYRLDTGRSFAVFQINKRTQAPDYALALKRYRRSTNRAEQEGDRDDEEDLPRSKKGLIKAMAHIHKEIMDSDTMRPKDLAFPTPPGQEQIEFLHIYDFLWNRMREMIKDVSRLDMKSRCSKQVISICEQMLRFFIMAVWEGRLPHQTRLEFDPKMNLEAITKILTQLLEIYESQHMKLAKDKGERSQDIYISPHEPEIISYAIVISPDIQNTLNQKLMLRLSGQGLDHPLTNSPQIQGALKIKKAIRNRNYQAYYQMLDDPNTDYVMSCLLLHHLPFMRKETLRMLYRISLPVDRERRAFEATFRSALRYDQKMEDQEYEECLIAIGAEKLQTKDGSFIAMSRLPDTIETSEWNLAYPLPHEKLSRHSYNSPNCPKRLRNATLMSREELSKRNWYEGNYPELVKEYFESGRSAPSTKPVLRNAVIHSPRVEVRSPEIGPAQTEDPKPAANLSFLLQKKKQFQRLKFIKSLEGLVQKLVKNSDIHCMHQRKKGLETMFELVDFMRLLILGWAFGKITVSNKVQRTAGEAMGSIERYYNLKDNFNRAFNRQPYEFKKDEHLAHYDMSSLLKRGKQQSQHQFHRQVMQNHSELISDQQGRSISLMFIFSSNSRRPLSQAQANFIGKLLAYLAHSQLHSKQQLEEDGRQLALGMAPSSFLTRHKRIASKGLPDSEVHYQITFCHLQSSKSTAFLSGQDAIIFIDLSNDLNPFFSLLKNYQQQKQQVYQLAGLPDYEAELNTPLSTVRVGSLSGEWNARPHTPEWSEIIGARRVGSSWHMLQRECGGLTQGLKLSMVELVRNLISQPPTQAPQLRIFGAASIIGQIHSNLWQIPEDILGASGYSLSFLEQYFNQCIKQIRQALTSAYIYYESYDWRQVLEEANYLGKGSSKFMLEPLLPVSAPQEHNIDHSELLNRKLRFQLTLVDMLSMNITHRYSQLVAHSLQSQPYFLLIQTLQEYLSLLETSSKPQQQDIVESVTEHQTDLFFEPHTVKGQFLPIFEVLLDNIRSKMSCLNFILPADFKFRLKRENFQGIKPRSSQATSRIQTEATDSKPKFVYCRAAMLDELNKQLGQEEEHYQGRKVIKLD